jgi:ribosome-binding protein aMBF1 (putative translation factor)
MECKLCGEEVDELVAVKVEGRKRKACAECAERLEQEGEIADGALGAMRDMMGYKGKW